MVGINKNISVQKIFYGYYTIPPEDTDRRKHFYFELKFHVPSWCKTMLDISLYLYDTEFPSSKIYLSAYKYNNDMQAGSSALVLSQNVTDVRDSYDAKNNIWTIRIGATSAYFAGLWVEGEHYQGLMYIENITHKIIEKDTTWGKTIKTRFL